MDLSWGVQRRAVGEDGRVVTWWELGEGDPVVCVHGFPDGPWAWKGVAEHLAAQGHRVVAPYLRGYHPDTVVDGRAYTADLLGDDVLTVMDAAEIDVAALVGHDWGATAVYAAAHLDPTRVRIVVPIGIPHQRVVEPSLALAWAVRHFVTFKLPLSPLLARARDLAYVRALYRRWAPAWEGPVRDALVARMQASFADPRVLRGAIAYYRDLSPTPPRAVTAVTTVPGLVIAGRHDLGGDMSPYEATPKAFDAVCELMLVDGAGHWPHLERPELVLPALATALAL